MIGLGKMGWGFEQDTFMPKPATHLAAWLELEKQGKVYEEQSDAVLNAKAAIDNAKLKEAGVEIIKLQGSTRAAYVNTIYSSKWAQNDQLDKKNKYIVDYQKLKSKMYAQPGS